MKALDLFCGAGGATKGLQQAGFHVTGVDINPQPHYCGDEFAQADALRPPVDLRSFDFIWASPPCQAYTSAAPLQKKNHPRLIEPIREMLVGSGAEYAIENVPGAPLINPLTLCGRAFGLNVKRHRLVETTVACLTPPCPPGHPGDWLIVFGWTALRRSRGAGTGPKKDRGKTKGHSVPHEEACRAMGIDWMTPGELSESIPPAYSRFIGEHAIQQLIARGYRAA